MSWLFCFCWSHHWGCYWQWVVGWKGKTASRSQGFYHCSRYQYWVGFVRVLYSIQYQQCLVLLFFVGHNTEVVIDSELWGALPVTWVNCDLFIVGAMVLNHSILAAWQVVYVAVNSQQDTTPPREMMTGFLLTRTHLHLATEHSSSKRVMFERIKIQQGCYC